MGEVAELGPLLWSTTMGDSSTGPQPSLCPNTGLSSRVQAIATALKNGLLTASLDRLGPRDPVEI